MKDILESARHVACDFFLDVELLCVVRDAAVFDFGDEIRVVKLNNIDATAGDVGRLALFHTRHGERWRFRPYRSKTWRRVPDLDAPCGWAWRCSQTSELTTTAIGAVPNHMPTALLPLEEENDFPF